MSFPWNSMSIASFGESTLPKETKRVWATKETNKTSDVDGAQPSITPVWKKPDLWDNSDVSGAQSMKLHRSRNVENTSLKVDDIDGAQAKIRDKMLLTKRSINPMEPNYKLPSCTPAAHEEPRFLRNTLNIDDIEKARPTIPRVYDMRDPISVHDIVGAQANWRPRHEEARLKAPPFDLMNSTDISKNTHRYIDKTNRHNCPLDPNYMIHGDTVCDNPRYAKPKGLPKYIADNHLLQTKDIAGAYSGWSQSTMERREFKNTNFVKDIDGAQADTIKHSMVTKRCTNPQNKVYVGLDGDLLHPPVVSLLPPEIVTKPTLRDNAPASKPSVAKSESVDINSRDALDQAIMKSARSARPSPRRTSVFGVEEVERAPSPRAPLTAIDSAAYSTAKPPTNPNPPSKPPANPGASRSAWGTPRSARGGPETNYVQENYLGNTVGNATSNAIAFADKFVKSEMLIMPAKGSRPPTGGSGGGSARGSRGPVPQLDLNNMGTGALSARASGRQSAKGSARVRPSKESVELDAEIRSVRALG